MPDRTLRRLLALALSAVLVAGVLVASASAQTEPDGADVVETCRETAGGAPEAGERACRTAESTVWNLAAGCRRMGLDEDACSRIDGRRVGEPEMEDYEGSWVHRALTLQRALDADVPLKRALVPATHNSFNAFAYDATFSGLDANQVYPLADQLRMDMRGLELDVHWAPSAEGDPAHGGRAPILCHGEGVEGVHVGCTTERHLRHGLAEIRGWLDENPDEVVLLYLENSLDDDPAAHAAAAKAIENVLGDVVLKTSETCGPMPTDMSRDDIRAAGARVLIVGNCDTGIDGVDTTWGTWVHERARDLGVWWESGSAPGTDYPSDCGTARDGRDYDGTFIRYFEGQTWLQTMAAGIQGQPGEVTVTDTERMVRCGVNLFGFDHLTPQDPRLEALVWSWAPDEPSAGGAAYRGTDGRFRAADPDDRRPAACRTADGWTITRAAVPWTAAANACRSVGTFDVPRTGWENHLLGGAADGVEVWVDYAVVGGVWTPDAS